MEEKKKTLSELTLQINERIGEFNHEEQKFQKLSHDFGVLKKDLNILQHDNINLKETLRSLGEQTNQEVNQMDSKIVGINRIRNHEKENFALAQQSVEKEVGICTNDMENEFKEKHRQLEMRISEINSDKEVNEREIREFQTQIKTVGQKTEQDARYILEQEKDLADRARTAKSRELEGKMHAEFALRDELIRRNDEKIKVMEDLDHRFRNNVANAMADNQRLKAEWSLMAQSYQRIEQEMDGLGRDFGLREAALMREEKEREDYKRELHQVLVVLDEELKNVRDAHERDREFLEDQYEEWLDKIKDVEQRERETTDEYNSLRAKYNGLIDQLDSGLKGHINTAFDDFHRDDSYVQRESDRLYESRRYEDELRKGLHDISEEEESPNRRSPGRRSPGRYKNKR